MKNNIIKLPVKRTVGLRKPEPITHPAEITALPVRRQVIALPEKTRRINPLALKRREIESRIPEEDIMWRMAMKKLDERGRTGPARLR